MRILLRMIVFYRCGPLSCLRFARRTAHVSLVARR
jgi:hypothetical protein